MRFGHNYEKKSGYYVVWEHKYELIMMYICGIDIIFMRYKTRYLHVQMMGYASNASQANDNNEDNLTLADNILTSSPKIKWAVQSCTMMDGEVTMAEAIWNGQAIAVSDGSYKDQFGTAAYMLKGNTGTHHVVAVMVVPSDHHSQSPFCSELVGLDSIIHMVDLLCKMFTISTGLIQVGCDELSALTQTFGWKWHDIKAIQKANFDMFSALHGALRHTLIKWMY